MLAKHFPFGWELRGMTISQNFPRTLSHVTQTFRTKQINKNRFWLIWLPRALIIRNIMRGVIEEIQFKWLRYFNARVVFRSNILQFTSYDCNTFGTRFILQLYQCRSKLTGLILGQGNGDQFDIAGSSKYPMINGWKNKGKSEGDGGEVEYAITGNSKNRIRASGVPTLWYPNIAFRHISVRLMCKQFFTKPRSFITDSLSVVWTI